MDKTKEKIVKNILIGVFILVVIFCAIVAREKFSAMEVSKVEDIQKLREERSRIVKEARELDLETQKIVLTDDLLNVEYRLYYSEHISNGLMNSLAFGAAAFVLLICFLAFIMAFITTKFSIKKSIRTLKPVPIVIIVFLLFQLVNSKKLPPSPEEAEYNVNFVKISKKDTNVTVERDENGMEESSSVAYRIYFMDRKGVERSFAVTADEYKEYNAQEYLYAASAEKGDEIVYYKYYDPISYKAEKLINVAGIKLGSVDGVDKELLRKMYTQLFSKDSFVEEYEADNAARYLARLFIDYDEWKKVREELESQGWNCKVGYFKSLRVKYPDDVLSNEEKMSAAAHYHLVHEVEIPEKRTVEESILAINKEDEGGMTILYSVYVYHD